MSVKCLNFLWAHRLLSLTLIGLAVIIGSAAGVGSSRLISRWQRDKICLADAQRKLADNSKHAPAAMDFTAQLPGTFNASTLIDSIFKVAQLEQVRILTTQASDITALSPESPLRSATLEVKAQGGYPGVRGLILQLLHDQPGLVLKHLTLRADSTSRSGMPDSTDISMVSASATFDQWFVPTLAARVAASAPASSSRH